MDRNFSTFLLALGIIFFPFQVAAQRQTSPPRRVVSDLRQIARISGLIFTGTVTSIAPVRAANSDRINSVAVTFDVEQSIRGPRAGKKFTIREWSGLWSSGERYRVGQRVMLFLYPPSRLGLTSPVGGSAGRFEIDSGGQIRVKPVQVQFLGTTAAPIRPDDNRGVSLRALTRAIRGMVEE